ncbi:hypothetical protein BSLG_000445 [Batrachochytrium salamandrivorans]|nr:hypothetical protein BSLG_000445 [Batrachochytrium salamandrivorans]
MKLFNTASAICLTIAGMAVASPTSNKNKNAVPMFINQVDEAAGDFSFLPLALSTGGAHQTVLSNGNIEGEAATGSIDMPMSGLKTELKSTRSSQGKVTTWNVITSPLFPKHSIRVRENVKLCDPGVEQYVGYLDTDAGDHFFFWFFESRDKPSTDPVILWLNGGPGCSSLTGLLMELGPCRANPGGNGTTINKSSWNENANVVFLDQPVNVGFSHGDGKVTDSEAAAADVYAFLQLFFQKYTKYSKLPFFVTGESYAGHYIPAIGKTISEGNAEVLASKERLFAKGEAENVEIHLKGLAIGNGLTDPLVQYQYYPDMACDTKYGPILDEQTCATMRSKYPTCKSLISACYNWKSPFTCVPGSLYCNSALIQPFQTSGKNIYDIRKDCDSSNPLCYSILNDIESWLNLPEIQEELGVDVVYQGCNREINMNFLMAGDWMQPYVEYIAPLLEDDVAIMIYAGDADYICNWIGNKAWTMALEWSGQEEFESAEDKPWISEVTGKAAGEYRYYENFSFVRVYEAGHMVPYDQPEHSLEMINYFMKTTLAKGTKKGHGAKKGTKKGTKKHV